MFKSIRAYSFVVSALIGFSTGLSTQSFETVHTSNAAILNRLGLSPFEIADRHIIKRLARPELPYTSSQSLIHQPYNLHYNNRDSHLYFVKLPSSHPYYTVANSQKANKNDKFIASGDKAHGIREKGGPVIPLIINYTSTSTGFSNNGKTAKIHHWNLPLMETVMERKRKNFTEEMKKKIEYGGKMRDDQRYIQPTSKNSKTSMENQNTNKKISLNFNNFRRFYDKIMLFKHSRNNDKHLNYLFNPISIDGINSRIDKEADNVIQKKTVLHDDQTPQNITSNINQNLINNIDQQKCKKHKKVVITYYRPSVSETGPSSIHKNFPGNGKLKALYVMEKSRKPIYYHALSP